MLFFAHVGLTVGAGLLLRQTYCRLSDSHEDAPSPKPADLASESTASASETSTSAPQKSRFLDWRLLILGAVLPDLIDKPLGTLLLRDTFNGHGRIFAHTLLFSLVLLLLGMYLYKQRDSLGLLVVGLGSAGHLILDGMWRARWTETLLWPLQGWTFPEYEHDFGGWIEEMLEALSTNPAVFLPEAIGAAVIGVMTLYILRTKDLPEFIKTGRIVEK
jgi:hypothetical protein